MRRATKGPAKTAKADRFLSTLSLRRATVHYDNYNLHCVISIHALLAESDPQRQRTLYGRVHFYPRSPCGERLVCGCPRVDFGHFYPRSPCGERPNNVMPAYAACGISIHALLAESDRSLPFGPMTRPYFYPRSPCGERRFDGWEPSGKFFISIHALLAESDHNRPGSWSAAKGISIHALLAESD